MVETSVETGAARPRLAAQRPRKMAGRIMADEGVTRVGGLGMSSRETCGGKTSDRRRKESEGPDGKGRNGIQRWRTSLLYGVGGTTDLDDARALIHPNQCSGFVHLTGLLRDERQARLLALSSRRDERSNFPRRAVIRARQ